MKQLDIDRLPDSEFDSTVVTIGNFDGVHTGHQELISQTVRSARMYNLKSVVITFDPHPAAYFIPEHVPPAICSHKFKLKLIEKLGVDAILTLKFDKELASLKADEYVKKILLNKLNAQIVWIGYDFTFGYQRRGTPRILVELGEKLHFQARVLSPQRSGDIVVSSTKIREFIQAGEMARAAILLARRHITRGIVVHGDREGRALGFPTININVSEGLIPLTGIYSGVAKIDSLEYAAAIYIGNRPTYNNHDFRVEAHLIDFSGNLYGKSVSLAFFRRIRNEEKFNNIDDLKKHISSDCDLTAVDFEKFKKNCTGIPIIW